MLVTSFMMFALSAGDNSLESPHPIKQMKVSRGNVLMDLGDITFKIDDLLRSFSYQLNQIEVTF